MTSELIFTYRVASTVFVDLSLAGYRRVLRFDGRTCAFEIPKIEPEVDDATTVTDGRHYGPKGGAVKFISIGAVRVGVEISDGQSEAQLVDAVTDCREIADRFMTRMLALLASRGRQFSLGLVEQSFSEAVGPTVRSGNQERKLDVPRPHPRFSPRGLRSVRKDEIDSYLTDISTNADLHEALRLLADAYYLCHSSSPAERRHSALLGGTACEVAAQQLLRQLCSEEQRPLVDVLLSRKPHVAFIFNEACFAIKGRRLRDEHPDVARRLELLQSYRNKVAHEGALPDLVGADEIRGGLDAALEAIEWFKRA